MTKIHYIRYLADVFISRGDNPPWSNVGLRALLNGPTPVWILLWLEQSTFHVPVMYLSLKYSIFSFFFILVMRKNKWLALGYGYLTSFCSIMIS